MQLSDGSNQSVGRAGRVNTIYRRLCLPRLEENCKPLHYSPKRKKEAKMNADSQRINRSPSVMLGMNTLRHEKDHLLQQYLLSELRQNPQGDAAHEHQRSSKKPHSSVTFSKTSRMHVYAVDSVYDRSKSYLSSERKSFGQTVLSDAVHIKRLVMSTPGATTKDAFKYLLMNGHISTLDVLGIEHLVFPTSMSQCVQVRRQHTRAILLEQARQRREKTSEDATNGLGRLSAARSVGSARKARARAAMAA